MCSCKVRMSGLCKVEMSAFLGAGGPDGRGADRVEREEAQIVSPQNESVRRGMDECSLFSCHFLSPL
jgi:hypothetical protein